MQKLVFQVEFLSDIVLPASSNTEGNISQLDFIPGSNFLGMTAKEYDKFKAPSFDIFHSGKVRFGDATLLVDGKEAYKMPFSLFHPKLKEEKIFNHHFLSEEKRKELGQLKQMRRGYILADMSDEKLKVEYLNYNYAQKSAYDSSKRRSKTSSMYGYRAIASGTKWQFVVKVDESIDEKDIKLLKETLESSKRLGKSKSSQYGQIEITETGTTVDLSDLTKLDGKVYLYAKSRIALIDKDANPTYDLSCLFDGAEVVYDKCQIRTSTFTPYNGAMQTKTYERLVVEAGSVIVLKSLSDTQVKAIESGVGAYLAEGFGELLVNPSFLMKEGEMTLSEKSKTGNKEDQRQEIEASNNATVQFLVNRHNAGLKKLELADKVREFMDDNESAISEKMNAQWGAVRSLTLQAKAKDTDIKALNVEFEVKCADSLEKLLFEDSSKDKPEEKPKGFLMSKKSKDKWDQSLIVKMKSLRNTCKENKIDYVQFVRLLSIEAPKYNKKESKDES